MTQSPFRRLFVMWAASQTLLLATAGPAAAQFGAGRPVRRAEVLLSVSPAPPADGAAPVDTKAYRQAQAALVRSPAVLSAAAAELDLNEWNLPAGEELVGWLRGRVSTATPANSNLLRVAVRDPEAPQDALISIVQELCDAYIETTIDRRQSEVLEIMQILHEEKVRLRAELRSTHQERRRLLAESPSVQSPEVAVRVELMRSQIGRLEDEKLWARRSLFEKRLAAEQLGRSAAQQEPWGAAYERYQSELDAEIDELTNQIVERTQENPRVAELAASAERTQTSLDAVQQRINQIDLSKERPPQIRVISYGQFYEG